MPIFKYTVANIDGKKLSGTVEAPSEKIARTELNNLGFSILHLEETTEIPKVDSTLDKYIFEAIDKNSKLVSGSIPAQDEQEAFSKLHTEYALTVTAIWKENATEEEISEARKKWSKEVQQELKEVEINVEKSKKEDLKAEKETQFVKTKIENVLAQVHKLLSEFDNELDKDQKVEINKKINKLLRIKNSTNLDYILGTAEELLIFIQDQEKSLKEKGYQDKRLTLQIKSKQLIDDLNKSSKPKSLSEDIVQQIDKWEDSHTNKTKKASATKLVGKILERIKKKFQTRPEIMVIKQQIKVYNKQLWDFAKLYFKEPTPEYKLKVKNSMNSIWKARKKAIHSVKQAKKLLKERIKNEKIDENLMHAFIQELNAFSGWLLGLYVIYYIVSLYISTKDFGLSSIPSGFFVYDSRLFKYIFGILFILHTSTSLKVNFFKRNLIADIALPIFFIFGSIIIILNF